MYFCRVYDEIFDDLRNVYIAEGCIFMAEKSVIEDIIGLGFNQINAVAAIIDVPPHKYVRFMYY